MKAYLEIELSLSVTRIPAEPANDVHAETRIDRAEIEDKAVHGVTPDWTNYPPTEDGWYFFRHNRVKPMRPVLVEYGAQEVSGEKCLWIKFATLKKQYPDCQWARIPSPGQQVPAAIDLTQIPQAQIAAWESPANDSRKDGENLN
jgi:hypothetical protein